MNISALRQSERTALVHLDWIESNQKYRNEYPRYYVAHRNKTMRYVSMVLWGRERERGREGEEEGSEINCNHCVTYSLQITTQEIRMKISFRSHIIIEDTS